MLTLTSTSLVIPGVRKRQRCKSSPRVIVSGEVTGRFWKLSSDCKAKVSCPLLIGKRVQMLTEDTGTL